MSLAQQQNRASSGILPLICYRAILRWCDWVSDTPFEVTASQIQHLLPEQKECLFINKPQDVRIIVRQAYKRGRYLYGTQANNATNKAFQTVQFLYNTLGQDITLAKQANKFHQQRERVSYHVGQVFKHRKFGYKGVIVGWDRQCDKPEWAEKSGASPEQPFYRVLPDEQDCMRIFQCAQHVKYVAQENIVDVSYPQLICHRHLYVYFPFYNYDLGRYIPSRRLQYEYPDNYFSQSQKIDPTTEQYEQLLQRMSNDHFLMNRDYPEEEDVHVSDWYLRKVEECMIQEERLVWQ